MHENRFWDYTKDVRGYAKPFESHTKAIWSISQPANRNLYFPPLPGM
ncbi:hypothetical protein HMPREF1146_1742 [Prevotella sp. MSX73]|nr:hypothetical protein HMPREF1146_1742 [Prevotella sp. MSX73]